MKRANGVWIVTVALLLCLGCSAAAPQQAEAPSPMPTAETTVCAAPTPVPTPVLTPEPTETPTPTPVPTPEPITVERLDAGEFDAYFDDAVFVGDSLTRQLESYVRAARQTEEGFLGKAHFMDAASMSVKNACQDRANPNGITFKVRGKAVSVTEGLLAYDARKAFILLGTNDIGFRTWDSVEGYYAKLIDVIHEKCPDTEVILIGVLPVTEYYCSLERVKIERWNSFNAILEQICAEHGAAFLNFADQMMDRNGYLPYELCNDSQYHLSEQGEKIWIRAMRLYAARQMLPDAVFLAEDGTGEAIGTELPDDSR